MLTGKPQISLFLLGDMFNKNIKWLLKNVYMTFNLFEFFSYFYFLIFLFLKIIKENYFFKTVVWITVGKLLNRISSKAQKNLSAVKEKEIQ